MPGRQRGLQQRHPIGTAAQPQPATGRATSRPNPAGAVSTADDQRSDQAIETALLHQERDRTGPPAAISSQTGRCAGTTGRQATAIAEKPPAASSPLNMKPCRCGAAPTTADQQRGRHRRPPAGQRAGGGRHPGGQQQRAPIAARWISTGERPSAVTSR